jgi:hypothetical protein
MKSGQIQEYKIVCATTATKLTELVNAEIRANEFQPFGNIIPKTIDAENRLGEPIEQDILMQAMVRYL